jgi:hypothetical protein
MSTVPLAFKYRHIPSDNALIKPETCTPTINLLDISPVNTAAKVEGLNPVILAVHTPAPTPGTGPDRTNPGRAATIPVAIAKHRLYEAAPEYAFAGILAFINKAISSGTGPIMGEAPTIMPAPAVPDAVTVAVPGRMNWDSQVAATAEATL